MGDAILELLGVEGGIVDCMIEGDNVLGDSTSDLVFSTSDCDLGRGFFAAGVVTALVSGTSFSPLIAVVTAAFVNATEFVTIGNSMSPQSSLLLDVKGISMSPHSSFPFL